MNELFLEVNERYLPFLIKPFETHKNDPAYLELRDEIRNILDEFDRRQTAEA